MMLPKCLEIFGSSGVGFNGSRATMFGNFRRVDGRLDLKANAIVVY